MSWYGDTDSYAAFVARHGLTFPQVRDDDGTLLFAPFGVVGQPAFVFVDTDGEARLALGTLEPDEIDGELEAMVAD